ncbi:MAG: class C sortase [Faecousia sp.]
MKGNARRVGKALLILLLLIAFGVSCYLVFRPWFTRVESRREAEAAADTFLQTYHSQTPTAQPATREDNIEPVMLEDNTSEPMPRAELYAAMQAYNERIYAEGQSGLCDPWSYTVPALDLSAYGLEKDEAIGVMQIPSIGVSLPIYSGASSAHLNKGAALLSQTSFPTGGENTNTVIGAHRGWNAEDYLRDVEEVQIGDEIIVTNFWVELHYTVTEIKIIKPNDISQILIQDGRELLTVFTCHPYASGGKYRYLLICDRVAEEANDENATPIATELHADISSTLPTQGAVMPTVCIEGIDGEEFDSAATEILLVAALPWLGIAIFVVLLIIIIATLLHKKQNNQKG